ncbi:MAG: response regulator transcription factor [Hyphomonadaceae bacterium]|nr:response regulator transcription factor [Clostridia bacterium]
MSKLIYAVDDEMHIRELLIYNIADAGYKVRAFANAKEFELALMTALPDLVILDIMLPEKDGLEICRELRSNMRTKNIPIIMLTAKVEEIDKIVGLEMGGDDYVAKPFSVRELITRIKTLLRRIERTEQTEPYTVIQCKDIKIDIQKHEVYKETEKLTLTRKEFELLKALMSSVDYVLSRELLLDKIWGYEYMGDTRTVDVHIRQLRKHLKDDHEYYIETVRGIGYKFKS